jgi:glycosyltransferase involved in cell wall biosynthesis
MLENSPLVSVVIPAYNRANVIGRAIQSVLEQTYENFEIIVVDDGSTDGTVKEASAYQDRCEMTLKIHSENLGQNFARNTGLKAANGELISYLDSDDEFLPTHLETVVEILCTEPVTVGGVVTSSYDGPFESSTSTGIRYGTINEDALSTEGHGIWSCTGLTLRQAILNDIGDHDTDIIKQTDLDFFLQILSEYDLIVTNERLFIKHNDSTNQVVKDDLKVIKGHKRILEKHGERLSAEAIAKRHFEIGRAWIRQGNDVQASYHFDQATSFSSNLDFRYRIVVYLLEHAHRKMAREKLEQMRKQQSMDKIYLLLYLLSFAPASIVKKMIEIQRRI